MAVQAGWVPVSRSGRTRSRPPSPVASAKAPRCRRVQSGSRGGDTIVAISVQTVGQNGLNWPRWKRLVAEVEALGYAGLFCADHLIGAKPPDADSLDAMIAFAYAASHSQRMHFGPLVAPLTFRNPVMLARQASAIDDLSGGRMMLGLGTGWLEREHTMFGFALGDVAARMARFEEGLEVMSRLLRDDAPVTFDGRFFSLRDAVLRPRPARPGGPRLMVGGNGLKRTIPLAARLADVWNGIWLSPEDFQLRCARLDELTVAAGRRPIDLRRTLDAALFFGRDRADLERRLRRVRGESAELADLSHDALVARLRADRLAVAGTPDEVVAQIATYAAAGASEIMFQLTDLDDIDLLRDFARLVLPRVSG